MDNSGIKLDEVIESYDKETKKAICKTQNFYILLAFLLITIALLVGVGIYSCLLKYPANKNIYYHFTSQITN